MKYLSILERCIRKLTSTKSDTSLDISSDISLSPRSNSDSALGDSSLHEVHEHDLKEFASMSPGKTNI